MEHLFVWHCIHPVESVGHVNNDIKKTLFSSGRDSTLRLHRDDKSVQFECPICLVI